MSTLKNNWVDGDQYTPAAANAVANTFPLSGTYSSRPAAGYGGRVYYCTDVDSVYYDNGTSWVRIRAGKSGTGGTLGDVPTSGWTAVNTINSATFAADRDGMLLTVPTNVTNAQITGWFRTLSPASNYTATALLEIIGPNSSAWGTGLALRNSSSGSVIIFTVGINSGDEPTSMVMKSSKWSSPSAAPANYGTTALRWMMGVPNWLRIRDNGTNRYFEYSFNGIDWFTFYSVSRTDYITPDQIGVVAECAGQAPIYARLRSLNGIS